MPQVLLLALLPTAAELPFYSLAPGAYLLTYFWIVHKNKAWTGAMGPAEAHTLEVLSPCLQVLYELAMAFSTWRS